MLAEATLVSFALAGIAGVIWAVRLEGKVNGIEEKHDTMFEERARQDDRRHEENVDRLNRIENKVDALLRNGRSDSWRRD